MKGRRFDLLATLIGLSVVILGGVEPAIAQAATNCLAPPSGLVGWWAAEGDAKDSVAQNPGTLQGAVTFDSGQVGTAFSMRGGVDAVKIAASDSLNVGSGNGMSIEAWINPQTLSVPSPLVEWNHQGTNFTEWGVHFWILQPGDFGLGAGSLFANLQDANGNAHFIYTPAGTMVTGVWQHVAMTYDKASGLTRLYRNGGIVAEANLGTFQPETSYNLFLGRRPAGDSTRSYFGLLDEVSIYTRALAQNEIQDLYNSGTVGKCPFVDPGGGRNHPPTISRIPDQSVAQGKSTLPIPFTVADTETAPDNLVVTWSSSDPAIFPNGNVRLGGAGGNRTVILSATNQTGSAIITLSVSDGQAASSISFNVVVVPSTTSTQPPTIAPISDYLALVDEPTHAIELRLTDPDTPLTSLRLTGASSNPTLVPDANVFFGMAGGKWYVTVTPVFGRTGNATITVTVSDGTDNASTQFAFTVNPPPSGTARFVNSSAITIPAVGAASAYPSELNVTAMSGTISKLVLSIDKFSHANVHDVNMLLVAPNGQAVVLFSHVSGNRIASNVRVNLTDTSGYFLPQDFDLWSEPLKPAAFPPAPSFPAPAPSGGYGAVALSTFNGLSPNGKWSLYIYDDAAGSAGSIVGGWSLLVSTIGGNAAPTISDIPDQSTRYGRSTAAVPFVINDADTPLDQLTLAAGSSNPTLVPVSNIVFGGSGTDRTVTVTPAAGQAGTAVITVTVSDGDLSATDNFILTVNRAPVLRVSVNNATRPYGAPDPIFTGTLTGVQNGDRITATYTCTATPGSPVGIYAITPVFSDPDNNLGKYDLSVQNGTLTIVPAVLVATIGDMTRSYGRANPTFNVSYSGFVNGENASIVSGNLTGFSPANTNSPPGTYPIFVSGQSAPNYSIDYTQGTLTVTGAVLVVRADNATRAYGAPNPVLTGAITGIQNGDKIIASYISTASASSGAGVYAITPVLSDPDGRLSNYTVVIQNGILTVTRVPLTVRADDKSRMYGTDNPTLTGAITGLQNHDNITARYTTPATRSSPPDNYRITPSLLDPDNTLANYRVTMRYGTLTVTLLPFSLGETPPSLEVTANDQARPYGAGNPAFTGTMTGLQNGDNITATYTSTATASSPADSYAITPELHDPDGNLRKYTLITHDGALTVSPTVLNVSADDKSRPYGAANPAFTGTIVGLRPADNISAIYTSSATASSPPGSYAISAALNDPDSKLGNYTLNVRNGILTVRTAGRVKIISITRLQNQAHVTLSGDPNVTYTIQASTDLISWKNIGSARSISSGQFEFDEVGDQPFRFFRAWLP